MVTFPSEIQERLNNEKLITSRPHNTLPLLIHNYTPKCQYGYFWDEYTLQARGLITSISGEVVARGPKKFFNLGEHLDSTKGLDPIPADDTVAATNKMDGSLIIAFNFEGETVLATRGSFNSLQAQWATNKWDRDIVLPEGYSYCFEAIYPENRIVVDYGDTDTLVLLCVLDVEGKECRSLFDAWKGEKVSVEQVAVDELQTSMVGSEGWVLRYDNGLWVKVKTDWYIELHRLVTGLTERNIWSALSENRFDDLLDVAPDEMYVWVTDVANRLNAEYAAVKANCDRLFGSVEGLDRKTQAQLLTGNAYSGIVFGMLDGKDVSERIWRLIKPEASQRGEW